MDANKIKEAHNKCANVINESDLTQDELIATLAQLLIYSGQAITKKDIDIYSMDLYELDKEYYAQNSDNDIGLGLILNGASIMGTLPKHITGNEIAHKENHNDNQVSTTT